MSESSYVFLSLRYINHVIQQPVAKSQKLKTFSERCAANKDLFEPEKPRIKCIGLSDIELKLFKMVPRNVKDAKTTDDFKNKLKKWIWETSIDLSTSY